MKINEIFYSICGEGIHVGIPTVFIRLQGCNLRCDYCDTKYALEPSGGEEMSLEQVKERVYGLSKAFQWVLITGGEPLLQLDAMSALVNHLKFAIRKVEIETNGSINPPEWFGLVDCWSVDVKCPSSGPSYGTLRPKWLKKLRKQDQLKFVVGGDQDLDFVRGCLSKNKIRSTILVSPIITLDSKFPDSEVEWSRPWLQRVAEFCKEQNVRMSLQLHKVIWGNKKGV